MNYWKDDRDRNDFIIALFVILLFGWLLWFMVFKGEKKESFTKSVIENQVKSKGLVYPSDVDGDGVVDSLDFCPEEYGDVSNQGCPTDRDVIVAPISPSISDEDGDGIPDDLDSCMYLAGPMPHGCPDTDGDGVLDIDDVCPDEPGLRDLNGCPDSDGDGVSDQKDDCPNERGSIATKGCPDADGDGVKDSDDQCPNEKGNIENNGCPQVVTLSDTDQAKLDLAIQNIEFDYNSAQLKSTSKDNLKGVVEIMTENPSYRLKLDGYTDNRGDSESNLTLSQNRVNSCKEYLVSQGIDASRITSVGHGESDPIASNDTDEGRKQNRRVEFTIVQ